MHCIGFVRSPTDGYVWWTPRLCHGDKVRYTTVKKDVCSPSVGIKTPYPTIDTTKKPLLKFIMPLPPLIEHINEQVGLEEGIAATP
jgi:hypothetical protein